MSHAVEIKTFDNKDLDSYCNNIDSGLRELLDPITHRYHRAEGPVAKDRCDRPYYREVFDTSQIPSDTQRKGFELMVKLMEAAESLSGSLRYDVCADHTGCEYHDEDLQRTIDAIQTRLKETA